MRVQWEKVNKTHCSSVTRSYLTLCNPMDCSIPGLPHHLPEFAQVHVYCVGDAFQLSHPLMPSSSALSLSQHQGLFQWAVLIRWPKYWSFSFSISPSNEYLGLITFKDWSVWSPCCPRDPQESSWAPQFEGINSSVLTFFMVELSQLYMTTGKTIAMTTQTFVGRVTSAFQHTV